jgi:hypothetical protein
VSAFVCDGRADKLTAWNHAYPLTLDKDNVLDYVRFYFAHVVGSHGMTTVIDSVDDVGLEEEPTPSLRQSLSDKILPPTVQASLPTGGYQVAVTVLIRQTLYVAVFNVSDKDGSVTPSSTPRVIADLLPVTNIVLAG